MTVAPMQCPRCAGPFQIESSSAGLQVGCPHCGQPVQIPPLSEWGQTDQPPPPPEATPVEPPPHEPPIEEAAGPPPAPLATDSPPSSTGSDTFSLNCPHCQGEFQVTSAMSGTAVACPLCQQALQLPDFAGGSPAQPPPTSYQAPSGLSPQEAAFWRMPSAAGQGSATQSTPTSGQPTADSKGDAPSKNDAPAEQAPKRAAPSTYQYPPGMEPKEVGTRSADDPSAKPLTDTVADIDPMLPPGAAKPTAAKPEAEQAKSTAVDPMMPPSVEKKAEPVEEPADKSPSKEAKREKPSPLDAMLPPTTSPSVEEGKASETKLAEETSTETAKQESPTTPDPKIDSLLPPSAAAPSKPVDDPSTPAADSGDHASAPKPSMETSSESKASSDESKPADDSRFDSLLPPTASTHEPSTDESADRESSADLPAEETKQKSAKDAKLDSLLPPTAPATSHPVGPTIEEPPDWRPAAKQNAPEGSILIPNEDGSFAQVREPRPTVGYGEDEVETTSTNS